MAGQIALCRRDGTVRAYTVVDEERFEELNAVRWSLTSTGYAHRNPRGTGVIYLHRFLLGLERGDGLVADHINGDRLDNRLANLRVATYAESAQNVRPRGGMSRYRGVSYDEKTMCWVASAQLDGRRHTLGYYALEEHAARRARRFRERHMPFAVER